MSSPNSDFCASVFSVSSSKYASSAASSSVCFYNLAIVSTMEACMSMMRVCILTLVDFVEPTNTICPSNICSVKLANCHMDNPLCATTDCTTKLLTLIFIAYAWHYAV